MVPVLLKPSMVMAMELLAEMRELCHVPSDDVFMFGRPEALSTYQGGECLKKFTKLCGAQHPEALTSTNATACQNEQNAAGYGGGNCVKVQRHDTG